MNTWIKLVFGLKGECNLYWRRNQQCFLQPTLLTAQYLYVQLSVCAFIEIIHIFPKRRLSLMKLPHPSPRLLGNVFLICSISYVLFRYVLNMFYLDMARTIDQEMTAITEIISLTAPRGPRGGRTRMRQMRRGNCGHETWLWLLQEEMGEIDE